MIASLKNFSNCPIYKTPLEEMVAGVKTMEGLHKAIEQLWNSVALELDGRKFYGPIGKYAVYYAEQPKLFGDEVFNKFLQPITTF